MTENDTEYAYCDWCGNEFDIADLVFVGDTLACNDCEEQAMNETYEDTTQ